MKNKYYRLLSLAISLSMMFSICTPVMAVDTVTEPMETTTEERMQNTVGEQNVWKGKIEENNRVYLDEDGNKAIGLKKIDNKVYYFNEEGILQTGWQTIEVIKYYFSPETGERYENRTEMIDGVKYSFDKEGIYKVIEDTTIPQEESSLTEENLIVPEEIPNAIPDEDKIFENATPEVVQTGWQETEEGKKYLDSSGMALKGMQTIDKKLYYFDKETGILQIGWIKDENGSSYFAASDGVLYQNQLITFGDIWYYMGADGSVQSGIIEVNGSLYYANEKNDNIIQKTAGWIEHKGSKYFASQGGALYRNQLITFGDIWYYMGADGSVQSGIIEVNRNLYYANEKNDNIIQKTAGWIEYKGSKYFASQGGALYRNQLITFGDIWYYIGADGSVQSGIIEVNGSLYYANEKNDNIIQKTAGWIEHKGSKYFASQGGKLYQNQLISFGSTQYCIGKDGSVQYGEVIINGILYHTDENTGVVLKNIGWVEKNGKWYFAAGNGTLYRNQLITFGRTWYCMGADGSVQIGVVNLNGKLYYADKNTGKVVNQSGWLILEDEDRKYFVNPNGQLYHDQIITFGNTWYYLGADGSVQTGIVNNRGTYYYATENGVINKQARWIINQGKKYFSSSTGALYRNQFISFGGIYYYCGNDAAIVIGEQVIDGVIYCFDDEGVMKKEGGWGEYNGNKYYKNPATGFPYKNQWVTFGQTWYYANVNGFMVSGWQTIKGYRYYFYPSTKIMARNTTIDGIRIGADGRAALYSDRMATFSTVSTNNANGTYNMKRALSSFNQVIIQPGQTLSFFGVAGPCGQAEGYLPAGVVGGVGYGGGICQASTTLYGAALRAGLTIVERRNHSVPSTYVPIGQDAMVDYGSSDLKIKNNYDFPVKLVTYSYGNTLYAEVWGTQPSWYDYVNIESWYTSSNSAVAYRKFVKNGNIVRVEQLPSSYYY